MLHWHLSLVISERSQHVWYNLVQRNSAVEQCTLLEGCCNCSCLVNGDGVGTKQFGGVQSVLCRVYVV